VPLGADQDDAARLRRLGYATVAGLAPTDDTAAEAHRLGCTHVLRNGAAAVVSDDR
jgi:ATP phosphoribosyltransferase regulatory subunit